MVRGIKQGRESIKTGFFPLISGLFFPKIVRFSLFCDVFLLFCKKNVLICVGFFVYPFENIDDARTGPNFVKYRTDCTLVEFFT